MKRFLLLFLVLLTFAVPAAAQDDLTDLVLDAFARLDQGYRFTYTADATQTYLTADSASDTTASYLYEMTGAVSASGDFITSTTMDGAGSSGGEAIDSLTFDFERARVDGVDYVRLGENRTAVPYFAEVASGWHRSDALKAELDESYGALLLESLTQVNLPTDLPIASHLITSIAETDPAEIDGVPVHGFEVVIDGLAVYRESVLESGMVTLENLVGLATLLDAGEYDYTATLWIGADDGLLYRIEGEYSTFVPYSTVAVETDTPLPPYDHLQEGTFHFDLTDHGAVDPIAPPIA